MKVMILGANGLCGTSLVPLMKELFPDVELILIDPDDEASPPIIRAEPKTEELYHVLKSFGMGRGDVLIDLTTELVKLDVMQTADSLGISVIDCTCCELDRGALSVIDLIDDKLLLARYKWQVPHVAGAGMNPGNINALLGMMADRYGRPLDVTEWEMDSTIPFEWDGEGFATWSPQEFASEFSDESTFYADGHSIVFAKGPPVDNLLEMPNGEYGALCQHEELVKWAWTYGCKARYLYGYTPEAMEAIARNIKAGLELPLCRKLKDRVPTGGDFIGLRVEFKGGVVNGSISVDNGDSRVSVGSNATSYLVACGVVAAFHILQEDAGVGINWPDDHGEPWINFLTENKLCKIVVDKIENKS